MPSERSNERLLALVIIGAIALNYPFISLFSITSLLFGIPVLYLYLFLVWGGFILLTAMIVTRKGRQKTPIARHIEKPRG